MIYHIGNATVQRIWETDLNGMAFAQLLPGLDADARRAYPDWFPAGTFDGEGHAFMSLHAWLVRHEGRVILIDAGAGNDKERPQQKVLDRLSTEFLARLREAGVEPEEVDSILLTHIHSDHVGWNTRLEKERWVPTFSNAEVIVSDLEYAYGLALTKEDESGISAARARAGLGDPVRLPVSGTFADSIMPLAGKIPVRRVKVDGSEVLPGIRFLPTPGHSIDHASIELVSGRETALFSGDVFHHPVEIYDPDLVSVFCEFPDASRRSRRRFLDHAASTGSMVFSSHFPNSSAGRISRSSRGFKWSFS
ncbi:MBL fold metallo-hydrolase [Sphingomonas endolithica]|uniref:MBL fold metallo-hydrolase n=1 Tax=Sphingomonas endolithica TaxID=2972485 RepID=UPI0021AE735D|nr:MBL fold metallo-hydrolase [Sphingomonas sp. ZFBP2030]